VSGAAWQQGTIFELVPPKIGATKWTLNVLYSFCPQFNCNNDGGPPPGDLVAGNSGVLFGVTYGGSGAVFELMPPTAGKTTWTHVVLHRFCQTNCRDGANPNGILRNASGDLFGTTFRGGLYGAGVVFELKP
jgi:uncharacterized repeat protein (TIGR03803 family)